MNQHDHTHKHADGTAHAHDHSECCGKSDCCDHNHAHGHDHAHKHADGTAHAHAHDKCCGKSDCCDHNTTMVTTMPINMLTAPAMRMHMMSAATRMTVAVTTTNMHK